MTQHPAGPAVSEGPAESSTGATAAATTLAALGVESVTCLPGEETIALLDAIDAQGIELVVARHEQHAAFMAATHGRLTGRPGVLVTTLGPGATNATTGLAHGTLGGHPLLHLAGQKPVAGNREGRFQVLDLPDVARPVTKATFRLTDPDEVGETIADAWWTARAPRPGAVFVELPTDVATGAAAPGAPVRSFPSPARVVADDDTLAAAAARIGASVRPVLVLGGGAQAGGVPEALRRFADRTAIPCVALQTGVGAVSADHPAALPPIAMHRPDAAHLAIEEADLAVTVGYDPVEHPPLAWNGAGVPVVHVADWPARLQRGHVPESQLVGDPADSLDRLADRLDAFDAGWRDAVRTAVERQLAAETLRDPTAPPSPMDVIEALHATLRRDDVVALDNGSYKLWFARHLRVRRAHGLLLDNALATMGAGLAIATEAARLEPDRRVVAVVGDGGFLMNVGDLETAVRLGVDNLTVIVLRDDTFGFIADHQRERDRRRLAVDVGNPDFAALAEAFGVHGVRIAPGGNVGDRIREAVERPGLVVVDCPLDERADELLHDTDSLAGARARLAGG